ncbi:hypothetical protein DMP17_02735 [Pseudonocardia sp. TMWB2A]
MLWWPIFAIAFDTDDLDAVIAGADTFKGDGLVDMAGDKAGGFEFPCAATVDIDDDASWLLSDHALDCVQRS